MNIGDIKWPDNRKDALDLYLEFLLLAIENQGLFFNSKLPNPIVATRQYIGGGISDDKRRELTDIWWDYIDSNDLLRNFTDREALTARIAICLLTVTQDDVSELGENLSWFFELLHKLNFDMARIIRLMDEFFVSGN